MSIDIDMAAIKADIKVKTKARDALRLDCRDVMNRIEGGEDTPQLRERLSNLKRGYDRATADVNRLGLVEFCGGNEEKADSLIAAGLKFTESGGFEMPAGVKDALFPGLDEPGEPGTAGLSPLAAGLKSGNFDLKANPEVTTSGYKVVDQAFGEVKAHTWPSQGDLPRRQGGLVPPARDSRFLFPYLARQDARNDLVVQDFHQTAANVTGTVQRSPLATTDKANLDLTVESVTVNMTQAAIVLEDIPNALLENMPQLSAFLRSAGEFELGKAIDAHVRAAILAASPDNTVLGASDLVTKIRAAISTMRGTGASPALLVVDGEDAAALDLSQDSGGLLFNIGGTNGEPWGLRVVEASGDFDPLLIDPQLLGVHYIGRLKFDANPWTGFRKNLTDLRVECSHVMHIRNALGAHRIGADA